MASLGGRACFYETAVVSGTQAGCFVIFDAAGVGEAGGPPDDFRAFRGREGCEGPAGPCFVGEEGGFFGAGDEDRDRQGPCEVEAIGDGQLVGHERVVGFPFDVPIDVFLCEEASVGEGFHGQHAEGQGGCGWEDGFDEAVFRGGIHGADWKLAGGKGVAADLHDPPVGVGACVAGEPEVAHMPGFLRFEEDIEHARRDAGIHILRGLKGVHLPQINHVAAHALA
jgi:hypothetical protein